MIRTIVKVSGMICGMCETHINNTIRTAFPVRSVTSSRVRGETVILSDEPLDSEQLKQTINATGYIAHSVSRENVQKYSLLSRFLKRNT